MCHKYFVVVVSLVTSINCYRYPGYYGLSEFPVDADFASAYSGLTSGSVVNSLNKLPEGVFVPPGPIDLDSLSPIGEASSTSKSTDKSLPLDKASVPSYLDNHKNVPDLSKSSSSSSSGGGKSDTPKEVKASSHANTHRVIEKSSVKNEVKAKESFSMPSIPPIPSIDDAMKIDSDSEKKGHHHETSSAFHDDDAHSAPVHRQNNAPHAVKGRHKHVDNHEQAQQITPDYDAPVPYAHRQYTNRKRPSRHKNMRVFDYDYDVAYRSDFYWLIPLVIIIGIGVLILPLCSLFMTAMVSNGAINFTGKRRKRRSTGELHPFLSDQLIDTLIKVDLAIDSLRSTFQQE